MSKLITIFCESFDNSKVKLLDNIISKFDFEYLLMFVALTPLACFQFERLNFNYTTTEIFCDVLDIEFDPSKQQNNRLKVFQLYDFERQRSKEYWKRFVDKYLEMMYKDKPPYIICFGKQPIGLAYELSTNEKLCKIPFRAVNLF